MINLIKHRIESEICPEVSKPENNSFKKKKLGSQYKYETFTFKGVLHLSFEFCLWFMETYEI